MAIFQFGCHTLGRAWTCQLHVVHPAAVVTTVPAAVCARTGITPVFAFSSPPDGQAQKHGGASDKTKKNSKGKILDTRFSSGIEYPVSSIEMFGLIHLSSFCFTPLTTFRGLPARNEAALSTTTWSSLWRAAWVAQAMCGVM